MISCDTTPILHDHSKLDILYLCGGDVTATVSNWPFYVSNLLFDTSICGVDPTASGVGLRHDDVDSMS